MLKVAFWLLGRQVMAVIALQTCLACAGIWLLSHRLRSVGLVVAAPLGVGLLGAFPTLIAYEHALLTEVASFFFFSLLVYLVAAPESPSVKGAVVLALAIGLGYYNRSSLIYLAPVIGGIYIAGELKQGWKQPDPARRYRFARRAVSQYLIIAILPFLLAYPWKRNPKVSTRNGHVLLYGLVKQGVLPVNDPILGATAPVYANVIEQSKSNGVFPNAGLRNGFEWSVINPIYGYGSVAGSIFWRVIRTHPDLYFHGVARNLAMFSGIGNFAYDNALVRHVIFTSGASQIDPGPSWITPLGDEFKRTTAPSFISRELERIAPLYDWMVRFGLLATIAGFLVGVWRLDKFILAFTAPALAFIVMHALLLVSQDRMILPVQPVLLLNLIALPASLRKHCWYPLLRK